MEYSSEFTLLLSNVDLINFKLIVSARWNLLVLSLENWMNYKVFCNETLHQI